MRALLLISFLAITSCSIDGSRYLQGELKVDSQALQVHSETSRPLPEVEYFADGSWKVKPSSKIEELELLLQILTLP